MDLDHHHAKHPAVFNKQPLINLEEGDSGCCCHADILKQSPNKASTSDQSHVELISFTKTTNCDFYKNEQLPVKTPFLKKKKVFQILQCKAFA